MASGDLKDQKGLPVAYISFLLLDALAAVDNGVWVDSRGYKTCSVDISGITTATVQVRGSNAAAKPANTAHGAQIGVDVTADGIVSVAFCPRWIKCRISAWTAGTISASIQILT